MNANRGWDWLLDDSRGSDSNLCSLRWDWLLDDSRSSDWSRLRGLVVNANR